MHKLLCTLILCLLVISCSGDGLGDPQSSPESVARAYMEALSTGDCEQAKPYVAADRRDELEYFCTGFKRIEQLRIDEAIVRDPGFITNSPADKQVTFVGNLTYSTALSSSDLESRAQKSMGDWPVYVEEISGKWYILPGLSYP